MEELPFQQRLAGKKLARFVGRHNAFRESDYLIDSPETEELYRGLFAKQDHPAQVLYLAARLFVFPNYDKLRQNASESINKHFFSNLMGTASYAADGRQQAQVGAPGLRLENTDSVEANINQKISNSHRMYIHNLLATQILPGVQAASTSIHFTKRDIFDVCRHSIVLPPDRIGNATSAMNLGLQLRFSESLHISTPLIENIVRLVLRSQGIETSKVTKTGVQREIGLSGLIEGGSVESVFGKDVTFSIWSFFTNHLGPNLRNQVAHGLISDGESNNLNSIYAWWFFVWLILVYHPPLSYLDYIYD